jgi:flagellar biogenesis protein FliO
MSSAAVDVSGAGRWWRRLLGWRERMLRVGRRPPRRLRLCESLALGERRFVAVIEFEQARFLVGGTASSLVLLARLGEAGEAESC